MSKLKKQLALARTASRALALLSVADKNAALKKIANALEKNISKIVVANQRDLKAGAQKNLGAKLDRLAFTPERVKATIAELRHVARLPDPVGRVVETHKSLAKFKLQRVTVPFGVIAVIYESRPNVTVDVVSLAMKSGNAVVLRGSADALQTNRALVAIIRFALKNTRVPVETVQFVDSPDRKIVSELLKSRGLIDVVIPRGGKSLINFVVENAKVPIIETGASVVHLYVDQSADLAKAVRIAVNSKCRRVSICNALDTLLIHKKIAKKFLALAVPEFQKQNVKIHASSSDAKLAGLSHVLDPDFDREFLDYALNFRIVSDLDTAIMHIQTHSLGHTEAIVAEDQKTIEQFLSRVDAACVYANLSTQFSDGGQFGLGAEIGISTQKLHARGPFALEALTTYKWIGRGRGQIRK